MNFFITSMPVFPSVNPDQSKNWKLRAGVVRSWQAYAHGFRSLSHTKVQSVHQDVQADRVFAVCADLNSFFGVVH